MKRLRSTDNSFEGKLTRNKANIALSRPESFFNILQVIYHFSMKVVVIVSARTGGVSHGTAYALLASQSLVKSGGFECHSTRLGAGNKTNEPKIDR